MRLKVIQIKHVSGSLLIVYQVCFEERATCLYLHIFSSTGGLLVEQI